MTKIYACVAGSFCKDSTGANPQILNLCQPAVTQANSDCPSEAVVAIVDDPNKPAAVAPFDANAFCVTNGVGRKAMAGNCDKYVYCYMSNGVMLGQVYTCSSVIKMVNNVLTTTQWPSFSNGDCVLSAAQCKN